MLGPARFTHIENCTRQVCQQFKIYEAVEEVIPQLLELDETIATLRAQLTSLKNPEPSQPEAKTASKPVDYSTTLLQPPDPAKAQRLLKARQGSVNSLNSLIGKFKSGDISTGAERV